MKTNELLSWLASLGLLLSAFHSVAEETAVVKDGRINVRGQPSLVGEVITQLQKGEKVVVLDEIASSKSKTNEPSAWARIQMPANTPVWVFAPFIDPVNKTVKVNRLNFRAGPGENYSVVGRLEKGAAIREIRRVEEWIEIETPPGAYAFVAADLLTKIGSASVPIAVKPEAAKPAPMALPTPELASLPTPEPAKQQPAVSSTVAQPQNVVPAAGVWMPVRQPSANVANQTEPSRTFPTTTTQAPATASTTPAMLPAKPLSPEPGTGPITAAAPKANPLAAAPQTLTLPEPAERPATLVSEAKTEQPLRRIVRREGLVRSTISIQAPTYYELLSPANRKTINYLHTESLGINLKDYRGRRIVVSGEEGIDPRWPRTPVIEVETLELIP